MNPFIQEKFIEQLVHRIQSLEFKINQMNEWFLLQIQSYKNKIETLEEEVRSLQVILNVYQQRLKKMTAKKISLFQ